MNTLKKILVFLLIPYPLAFIGGFLGASIITSIYEGNILSWPSSSIGGEASPGYLVIGIIILIVQMLLGFLPLFFLKIINSGMIGYLISGLIVASLSSWFMVGGDSNFEFNLFVGIFFVLIIIGYLWAHRIFQLHRDRPKKT